MQVSIFAFHYKKQNIYSMMHYIRGVLIEKNSANVIVELYHSLGYEIQASQQTLQRLPEVGSDILLYTYLLIKEEKQVLYGFLQREERDLFQTLLKINNVGPKLALAILSELNIEKLIHVVQKKDIAVLQRIPGVGRKTAERLLLEMNNCLEYLMQLCSTLSPFESFKNSTPITVQQEAISALIALGYKQHIAYQAIEYIEDKEALSTEELIRLCLQQLAKR